MRTHGKKLFFIISLFICTISIIQIKNTVSAAEKKSQRLVCLKPVSCNAPGSVCKEKSVHRVRLTTEKDNPLIPSTETYIIECISTAKGQICTTGNADTHPQLGWETSLKQLADSVDYEFQGLFSEGGVSISQLKNPMVSDNQGMIAPVEWKSRTGPETFHTFYALNFYDPTVLAGQDSTSQKQGTFDLFRDTSGCTSIRWDPYGIVFDGKTLEPIPETSVTLSQKTDSGFVTADIPGVESEIITKADGGFNFVVPDGVYKLDASHPLYLPLPVSPASLNPDYVKMYSDIYPPATGSDEIIQSGGIPQHRDIALNPKPNTVGRYPISVLDYYQNLNKFTNTLLIKGRVSHPFAKGRVYTIQGANTEKSRYLELQIDADKTGLFTVQINLSSLIPGERIGGLEFEKADFVKPLSQNFIKQLFGAILHSIIPPVSAQENTSSTSAVLQLEPVVNYLEGFAYDSKGKVIPNAEVGVYYPYSVQPLYETIAQENGFFVITSEFLPSMPFILKYKSEDGAVTEAPLSTFLTQNSTYLEVSAINLYQYKDAIGNSVAPTGSSVQNGGAENNLIVPKERNQQIAFIIVVIIILLFGVAGVVLGYYYFSRKHTAR